MSTTSTLQHPIHVEDIPVEKAAPSKVIGPLSTASEVRRACRDGRYIGQTSGLALSYLQANLIVLPSRYASDFRNLCTRNPVPCPLLAESSRPGSYGSLKSYIPGVADEALFLKNSGVDVRRDFPKYNLYRHGNLTKTAITDICAEWDDQDSVAFLIGCSFSFETALVEANLTPRHTQYMKTVPMYRTKIPLCPSGVFSGSTYVVSMRQYPRHQIEKVRSISRPFRTCHGEPIDWGWDAVSRLGITDIYNPDFGDRPLSSTGNPLSNASLSEEDDIPVFWGCGVTPQVAVMAAGDKLDGNVIGHMPGHMLLLDVGDGILKMQT